MREPMAVAVVMEMPVLKVGEAAFFIVVALEVIRSSLLLEMWGQTCRRNKKLVRGYVRLKSVSGQRKWWRWRRSGKEMSILNT